MHPDFMRLNTHRENDEKRHKLFKVKGGLGNQLFQLAAALDLGLRSKSCLSFLHIDSRRKYVLDAFQIHARKCLNVELKGGKIRISPGSCKHLWKYSNSTTYAEPFFRFQELPLKGFDVYEGYWQSHKYFYDLIPYLRSFLHSHLHKHIEVLPSSSDVVLHVRLGDFLHDKDTNNFHSVLNETYFLEAVELLKTKKSRIIVVCENIDDFKARYPVLSKSTYFVYSPKNELAAFQFLSYANKIAIANSTFSWWAAFIGDGEVIAPKQWFARDAKIEYRLDELFLQQWKVI